MTPQETLASHAQTTLDARDASLSLSRLESLLESAQLLHASLDLEDLLRHLLRSVMGRTAAGRALVAVEEDGEMRIKLVRGAPKLKVGMQFDEQAVKDAGLEIIFTIGDATHPVGLLAISRPPSGEIDADEITSLNALLGIAASGIANARAHLETKRVNENLDQKVQELRALLDLVRGLAAALEPEAVASLLMLTLAGRWAVRRYTLAAWKDGHPAVVRAKGMKFDTVLDHKDSFAELPEAVRVADLTEGELKDLLTRQDAAIIFPLRAAEIVIGVVIIGTRAGGLGFTDSDLEFGAGLVAQASVAFENSWFVRETVESEKVKQELELAASIQAKLFPDELPRLAGYDLAAHNRPARQCGGDYYDALPTVLRAGATEGAYLFCVADVSGKGLPASLLMSNMQATLRALLNRSTSLAELAAHTNDLLHATTPSNKYVTAILAEFEPQTGRTIYVNAGHNGGLLLRCNGEHEWLKPTGTPVGLFPGLPYDEAEVRLEPGDLLALFSDGVPEAQDTSDEEFGEDRLLAYLRTVCDESAADIVAGVFREVDLFAGAAPQFDDITLVVIKRMQ